MRGKMREKKTARQLKTDRQRVAEKNRERAFQKKVGILGRIPQAWSWSMADNAETTVGRMSRALSIKSLNGCPAKGCYKRVMTSIFRGII